MPFETIQLFDCIYLYGCACTCASLCLFVCVLSVEVLFRKMKWVC